MTGMRIGGQLLEEGQKRLIDEKAERMKDSRSTWWEAYWAAFAMLKPRLEGRHAAMVGLPDPTLEAEREDADS